MVAARRPVMPGPVRRANSRASSRSLQNPSDALALGILLRVFYGRLAAFFDPLSHQATGRVQSIVNGVVDMAPGKHDAFQRVKRAGGYAYAALPEDFRIALPEALVALSVDLLFHNSPEPVLRRV